MTRTTVIPMLRLNLGAIACGLLVCTPLAAQDYFANKKISVIIGFAAGGGMDTVGRLFVRHFSNHVDGKPLFIIQNMPGAGATIARNYLANRAPKDGSALFYDSWNPMAQIVKLPQVRFDYAKFVLIGGLRGSPFMMFGRADMAPGGLKSSQDIMKGQNIVYGGQVPGQTLDLYGRLALDLLGVKYKYVAGYNGAAAIRLAIGRSEVSVTTHGMQGYRSGVEPILVKEGKAVPLWYFPHRDGNGKFVNIASIKDMPAYHDVYRAVRGEKYESLEWKALELLTDLYGSGPNFVWGPPGMDPRATAALRKAFDVTVVDKAYLAEQMKVFQFEYEKVPPGDVEKIIAGFRNIDPEVVRYFAQRVK